MVTTSPLATAEGMAVLTQTHGPAALLGRSAGIDYTAGHYPMVVPIDAEAQYYDSRLPVADPACIAAGSPGNPIPNLLGRHRGSCIVAGYGLIAAGPTGLDQAAYIVSAAERSARFRQEVDLHRRLWGGPPPTAFELRMKPTPPPHHLHARVYGSGAPLIILHGLFGSWENWHPVAKALSGRFTVHVVDQRNHGGSFHSSRFDYDAMAEDIRDFMGAHRLAKAALLGHSMGGKTAMRFAAMFPAQVERLIVVDIAPRGYPPSQADAIDALVRLDLGRIATLRAADEHLQTAIPDPGLRRFLLKNLKPACRRPLPLEGEHRCHPPGLPLPLRPRGIESLVRTMPLCARGTLGLHPRQRLAGYPDRFPAGAPLHPARTGHWAHVDDPAGFAHGDMLHGSPTLLKPSGGCCRLQRDADEPHPERAAPLRAGARSRHFSLD